MKSEFPLILRILKLKSFVADSYEARISSPHFFLILKSTLQLPLKVLIWFQEQGFHLNSFIASSKSTSEIIPTWEIISISNMFHTHDCFCRMLWEGAANTDKNVSSNSEAIIHYTSEGTMGEQ